MAPHSSILAWKIPWTEEPGGLQSTGSLRVRGDWATSLSLFLSCIGEGNGNPLQCSCLENPRDGGASWAAVYGVARSRTRLKRLSSSSSRLQPASLLCPWGFSRQEYWSRLSRPPPGDHPNPEMEPRLILYCLSHQRDVCTIPGLGRSPGGRQGNLHQYSCLENPMDGGAWWAIVHSIAKKRPWQKWLSRPRGLEAETGRCIGVVRHQMEKMNLIFSKIPFQILFWSIIPQQNLKSNHYA